MNTKTATKQVTDIKLGLNQVALASIKQTANPNKVMLEFGESMLNEGNVNPLAMLNASDERFNAKPSTRRVYVSAEKKDAMAIFGIPAAAIAQCEKDPNTAVELSIMNPTMDVNGKVKKLCIQINDSLVPSEYEKANILDRAKQSINAKGEKRYFIKDGKFIFQNTSLVFSDARKHSIINSDARINEEEATALVSELELVQDADASEAISK